jgi:hypothetical protein
MRVKKFAILCAALALSACSDDPTGGRRFTAEEEISANVALASRNFLKLRGINGNVEIYGIPGVDSISISVVKRVESFSVDDAEDYLDSLIVEIDSTGTDLVIRTVQPEHPSPREYTIDYTITMPESMLVDVTNVNGNVTLESITRDVRVVNTNGNIRCEDIDGSATMHVTNGGIWASVSLPPLGEIRSNVVNGNVYLQVPQSTNSEVTATVTNGSVTYSNLQFSDLTHTRKSLVGTLGTGEGLISLVVVNGAVTLRGF